MMAQAAVGREAALMRFCPSRVASPQSAQPIERDHVAGRPAVADPAADHGREWIGSTQYISSGGSTGSTSSTLTTTALLSERTSTQCHHGRAGADRALETYPGPQVGAAIRAADLTPAASADVVVAAARS